MAKKIETYLHLIMYNVTGEKSVMVYTDKADHVCMTGFVFSIFDVFLGNQ